MSKFAFIEGYKELRNIMGKKMITDGYIEHAAIKIKAEKLDDTIIETMFDRLKALDPYKADISANTIARSYRIEEAKRNRVSGKSDINGAILKQCQDGRCNKSGYLSVWMPDGRETVFSCNCDYGEDIREILPEWNEKYLESGYSFENPNYKD